MGEASDVLSVELVELAESGNIGNKLPEPIKMHAKVPRTAFSATLGTPDSNHQRPISSQCRTVPIDVYALIMV